MTRPTPRAAFVFGAGIPLALVLVLVDARLWPFGLAYLGLSIVFTGIDGILALPPRALDIAARLPRMLYVGESDALEVTVGVVAGWPAARAELALDVGPDLARPPRHTVVLRACGQTRVSLALTPKRRGEATVDRLWLRWSGPLNLMRRQRVHPIAETVPVIPNIRAVGRAAIRFSSSDALFGVKPQTQQGDGSEFESLRDYVAGLDHRSIDWKHSARHRRLVCKEFRAERNHHIVLAFDTGHLMAEPLGGIPKLDHAINAGLVLGYLSLRSGDRIGVFGFDSEVRLVAEPLGGLHNFHRLQLSAAKLAYRHDETNFTLGLADLLGRLSRRSLVIVQTEFVDTITAELMVESLERLAKRHLIIFITLQDPSLHAMVDAPPRDIPTLTRSVIADDFIRERMVVFERLRRLGIHCLDAPAERIGVDLVNRYLMIKRKELI